MGIIRAPAPAFSSETLTIPPPRMMKVYSPGPPKGRLRAFEPIAMKVPEPRVIRMGGAASKLLPETVKEENSEDKGAPLLNDND
jgi:hypothetical protein